MDSSPPISLTLPVLCTIGAAMLALLGGVLFLHNSAIDRFDRQNDIITESMRTELASFKTELKKLDTDVLDVDEKVQEVDTSVAVADFQSDLVKEDVVEVKEDVVGVKDEVVEVKGDVSEVKGEVVEVKEDVIEVKGKVDVIGSDLNDTADKIAVIKSALIVGFKDNEEVKLILTDDRLSMLLPEEVFSNEPKSAAAMDGDTLVEDIVKAKPKRSIAEYCQTLEGSLSVCYEKYLKLAEEKLLIGSIDE